MKFYYSSCYYSHTTIYCVMTNTDLVIENLSTMSGEPVGPEPECPDQVCLQSNPVDKTTLLVSQKGYLSCYKYKIKVFDLYNTFLTVPDELKDCQ